MWFHGIPSAQSARECLWIHNAVNSLSLWSQRQRNSGLLLIVKPRIAERWPTDYENYGGTQVFLGFSFLSLGQSPRILCLPPFPSCPCQLRVAPRLTGKDMKEFSFLGASNVWAFPLHMGPNAGS